MKRSRVVAAAAFAASLVLGTFQANAQQTGQMGQGNGGARMGSGMESMMGSGPGMMGGNCPMTGMTMAGGEMPAFSEGRIAFLKAELAITPDQQVVWDAYAAALKKNLTGMQGMRQTMMTAATGKTPVERLDAHVSAMESRLAAPKEVKPTLAKLFDALSSEQKLKAEPILAGMGCMM